MAITDTVLDVLTGSPIALTLDDLNVVLELRLGAPTDENELDDAITALLEGELVAFRRVGEYATPALAPFGEVTR